MKAALSLSKFELIGMWETGVLSNTAYIVLALRSQYQNKWADRLNNAGIGNSISMDDDDIVLFINDWSGQNPKNGKDKYLTHDQVVKALQTIAKAHESEITYSQIQLLDADNFLGIQRPAQSLEAIDGGRAA